MTNLQYTVLPLTNDPYQVFTLDTTIDGEPFRARFEVRYLSAPEAWAISLWDHATEEQLAGPIPLVAFFGRAAECIASAVSCAGGSGEGKPGPRAVLSPAGLTVMPPGGLPVSYTLTEQEILTAPSFVGGPLRGTPAEMILLTKPLGLHPGDTVAVQLPGLRCRGVIRERVQMSSTFLHLIH